MSPFDGVFYAHSYWLVNYPQFKVFWAVIGLVAVLVVHVLVWPQWAAKMLLHDSTMLQYPTVSADGVCPHLDVAILRYIAASQAASAASFSWNTTTRTRQRIAITLQAMMMSGAMSCLSSAWGIASVDHTRGARLRPVVGIAPVALAGCLIGRNLPPAVFNCAYQ